MIDALVGAFVGGATTAYSNRQNYEYQRKLQQEQLALQDKYQREYAADAPSIQKKALSQAGLNPMLAANMAPAGENLSFGPGFSGSDLSAGAANMMNSVSSAKQAKIADRNADAIEKNADSAARTAAATEKNADSTASKTKAEIQTSTALKELYQEQKNWLPVLNTAQAAYTNALTQQLIQEGEFGRKHPTLNALKGALPNVNLNLGFNNTSGSYTRKFGK